MPRQPIKADICIATFKRPRLLAGLLRSIAGQKVDGHIIPRLIIVDNDRQTSAREVVESLRGAYPFQIVYDIEPEQSITRTRNRCLSHTDGDVVVFVDDDEYVEENWLSELVGALEKYDADAVFGPVLPIINDETPTWIIKGGFLERPRFQTGTIRNSGATCNAAVKRSVFRELQLEFDASHGLRGGEDYVLFLRMIEQGAKLIWCDSAIVHEHVPLNRLKVRFFIMRAFRGGQNFSCIALQQMSIQRKLLHFLYRLFLSSIALVLVILATFGGKVHVVKALQKLSANIGQLTAFTRYRYREYASSEYVNR